MNIEDIKSDLKMKNLFFSECSFEREKELTSGKLNVNLEKQVIEIKEHVFDVILTTQINSEGLKLKVVAQATFELISEDYSIEKEIINCNTVAIMFPFIRSEVTLLTSQPGMMPIVLPAINTSKM